MGCILQTLFFFGAVICAILASASEGKRTFFGFEEGTWQYEWGYPTALLLLGIVAFRPQWISGSYRFLKSWLQNLRS